MLMRRLSWLLVSSLLVVGCGGSVDRDGGGNASGGTGNTGNTGNTGGNGNTGNTGGSSGGSGGDAPFCCQSANDCPTLVDQNHTSMVCVAGNCKMPPPADQCWQDSDCQFGQCHGAGVCPCGNTAIDCIQDQLGSCMSPAPRPSTCCDIDMDCGDEEYVPCVNGTCKQVVADGCWKDEECPLGQTCVGASVCPCDALCAVADYPGKCM